MFGLTHHPNSFLRLNVSPQLTLLFLLAKINAIRYHFKFILQLFSALPQLAQPDGLKFFGKEYLLIGRHIIGIHAIV